jgi:hypothetical protein
MELTKQMAKHLREIHFGKNWTWSYMKEHLDGLTWEQATTRVGNMNTIATLVNHMHYYVARIIEVLEGKALSGSDKESFRYPPIRNQQDWEAMVKETWDDAEHLAVLVEQMPEGKLWELIGEEKYGNFYRNIHGVIEHNHYHLGQIVLLRKLIGDGK